MIHKHADDGDERRERLDDFGGTRRLNIPWTALTEIEADGICPLRLD